MELSGHTTPPRDYCLHLLRHQDDLLRLAVVIPQGKRRAELQFLLERLFSWLACTCEPSARPWPWSVPTAQLWSKAEGQGGHPGYKVGVRTAAGN